MELTKLAGIGKARALSFEENDIFSCEDLINYFPYKYYDFSKTEPFADDGKVRLIKVQAIDSPKIVKARKGLSFATCKMMDSVGQKFNAVWYNQTYIKSQIHLGDELYLYGKNSPSKKNTFIVNIYKFCDKFNNLGYLPVYKTIASIGQQTLNNSIISALEMLEISSFIPNILLQKYNLLNLKTAYTLVHNPKTEEEASIASQRIEIERLIPILAINQYHKLE